MEQNSSKSKKLLLAGFIIVSGLALYFAIKTYDLSQQITELKPMDIAETNEDSEKRILEIDSMIMIGQYENALQQSEALRTSNEFKSRTDLSLRYKVVSDILSLKNGVKRIKSKNEELDNELGGLEIESGSSLDSLESELNNSKRTIKNLQNRLNSEPTSDYITFKTTKGTNLHYVGNIKNNMANGYGIALLDTGSRYEGAWSDNKRHGHGKFYWDDGEIYDGDYKDDMRHGTGTYFWSNGEKYVGEWKNDMRNGKGKFYNKKGKLKAEGTWKDDELVED